MRTTVISHPKEEAAAARKMGLTSLTTVLPSSAIWFLTYLPVQRIRRCKSGFLYQWSSVQSILLALVQRGNPSLHLVQRGQSFFRLDFHEGIASKTTRVPNTVPIHPGNRNLVDFNRHGLQTE